MAIYESGTNFNKYLMRKLTEDFIGTCQACLGQYKVNAKSHRVTLHGYQRPGYGHVIGRCQGVDHQPFEYDKSLTEKVLVATHDEAQNLRGKVKLIDDGKLKRIFNPSYLPENKRSRWYDETTPQYITAENERFPHLVGRLRAGLLQDIRYLDIAVEHYEMLIRTWVHQKIVGIDTPATGRTVELRDGYDPKTAEERVALDKKRAERAAKPGKLFLSIYESISYPNREGTDDEAWNEGIEAMYVREAKAKSDIKAWAKKSFPNGKVWVGDVDTYFVERHHKDIRDDKTIGATVKPDWSYLDDLRHRFGQYIVVDNPKEVRFIIPAKVALISPTS